MQSTSADTLGQVVNSVPGSGPGASEGGSALLFTGTGGGPPGLPLFNGFLFRRINYGP